MVGAANSAVDVALETYRKGAKEVTMIVREPSLSETVKYWVKPDVENRINEGSIKSYFNSNIKKIDEKSLTLSTPEGEVVIENDFVLAMTGYQPDFSFLKRIGIKIGDDEYTTPFHNPDTMETNVEGVYDDQKKLISEIKPLDLENLIKWKVVHGGMIPKIENCVDAVQNGVRGVVILDGRKPHSILHEIFSDKGSGTLIRE